MQGPRSLSLFTRVIYGSGDFALSSFNTFRQVFYAIFLTDVVGCEPRLAAFAALLSVAWDAVNDPIIGALSDRVRTSWGRRRPFLLLAAIPFGLAFVVLWWAPPWQSQLALAAHVTLAYMLSDTLQTLVAIPYYTLTPELARDYDERTSLTSWRMFFNLAASLAVALAAPGVVDLALERGLSQQQGFLIVASAFGLLGALPFLAIFAFVRERSDTAPIETPPVGVTLRQAWQNRPFRYLSVLYMLNWITFDLVGLMVPFLITYHVAGGDLTAKADLFGVTLSVESATLGLLLVTALVALPVWNAASLYLGKCGAYVLGIGLWAFVEIATFFVQPGQYTGMLFLAGAAGVGVAAAHVIPNAMIPDVVDLDELDNGTRNEGVYYGAANLLRKSAGAIAIFLALQALGWAGYQRPAAGVMVATQPESALIAIRLLAGPAGAALLLAAIAVAWAYPLTRARHAEIRAELERAIRVRRERSAGRRAHDAGRSNPSARRGTRPPAPPPASRPDLPVPVRAPGATDTGRTPISVT